MQHSTSRYEITLTHASAPPARGRAATATARRQKGQKRSIGKGGHYTGKVPKAQHTHHRQEAASTTAAPRPRKRVAASSSSTAARRSLNPRRTSSSKPLKNKYALNKLGVIHRGFRNKLAKMVKTGVVCPHLQPCQQQPGSSYPQASATAYIQRRQHMPQPEEDDNAVIDWLVNNPGVKLARVRTRRRARGGAV